MLARRTAGSGDRGHSTARLPAPARGTGRHADLLTLQQQAGNAAVTGVVNERVVQRDEQGGKPGGGVVDVIFIIRKPNDRYTADMTNYVKTTLHGHLFREVANIDEICAEAAAIAAAGNKIGRVRLVGHGQTVIGGVGMTPPGEKTWRFVKPDEVKAYMTKPACQGLRKAMAPKAEVEFWGCYLGGIQQAGEAWADLFGAQVKSTSAEVKIGDDRFYIGKNTAATSSKKIPKGARENFRKWLLDRYRLLLSTGEAPALKTDEERVAHMTDLFDRSAGVIRTRVLQQKGSTRVVRPGESDEVQFWETVTPTK
jgi:hypothetical protein